MSAQIAHTASPTLPTYCRTSEPLKGTSERPGALRNRAGAGSTRTGTFGVLLMVAVLGVLMLVPTGAMLGAAAAAPAPGATTTAGTPLSTASTSAPGAPATTYAIAGQANDLAHSSSVGATAQASGTWLSRLISGSSNGPEAIASYPALPLLEHPAAPINGEVYPPYVFSPDPAGVADLGLGSTTAYSYSTPHFLGTITFSAPPTVFEPGSSSILDPGASHLGYAGSPLGFSIELNTVLTNVTIPGTSSASFWTENLLQVNGSSLHFVDDIYNQTASSGMLIPSTGAPTLASGCGLTNLAPMLAVYGGVYQCVGSSIAISSANYPLTISLYNNATVVGGNDVVSFGYLIQGASGLDATGVSDTVTFDNPSAPTAPSLPIGFTVSGSAPTPEGLLQDAEFVLGGSSAGANAAFSTINGTMQLEYSNVTSGGWQAIPAGYDFGADTGETSVGVAEIYTGTTVVDFNQGPQFLFGMWNAASGNSVRPGSIHLSGTVSPTYAVLMVSDEAIDSAGSNYTWFPSSVTGTFSTYLPAYGIPPSIWYFLEAWAPGSVSTGYNDIDTSQSLTISLVAAPAHSPITSPIVIQSNAQALALETALMGTTSVPYRFSGLMVSMNLSFNHLNDYGFPTFEIFSAQNLTNTIQVNNLFQGPDSTTATFYYWDAPENGATGLLFPKQWLVLTSFQNYSEGIVLIGLSHPGVTYENLTANDYFRSPQGGQIFLWDDSGATVNHTTVYPSAYGTGYGGVFVGDSTDTAIQVDNPQFGATGADDVGSTGTSFASVTPGQSDSTGVLALSSSSETFTSLEAADNATGLRAGAYLSSDVYYEVRGVTGVSITNLDVVDPGDFRGPVTTGASFAYSSEIRIWDTSATGYSQAVVASHTTSLAMYDLYNFLDIDLTGATFTSDVGVTVTNVTFYTVLAGIGLLGTNDAYFNVTNVSNRADKVLPVDLTDVATVALTNGSGAYVVGAAAPSGLTALKLDEWSSADVLNETASNGGIGIALTSGSDDDAVSWVNVSSASVGVELYSGVQDTVSEVQALDGSAGVLTAYSTNLSLSDVTTTSPSLGAEWPATFVAKFHAPVAAIASLNVSNAVITSIRASNEPVGLYDGACGLTTGPCGAAVPSEHLFVDGLNATNGDYAVYANYTVNSQFLGIGAYDDLVGVYLHDDFHNSISGGAFTDDASYGIELAEDSAAYGYDSIWLNAFIGNNGAGSSYDVAHVQAFDSVGTSTWYLDGTCGGNYWSDWTEYAAPGVLAPYPIPYDSSDACPLSTAPGQAVVEFDEYGLPTGANWSLTFNGTTASTDADSQSFTVAPGSYGFSVPSVAGYTVAPTNGTVVAQAEDVNGRVLVDLEYTAVTTVTLTQSGLSSGTSWSAIVAGIPESGTGASLTWNLSAGTYAYQVRSVAGYTVAPANGSINVGHTPYAVDVTFTPIPTPVITTVTLAETGLPAGTHWSALFGGTLETGNAATLSYNVTPGTYAFQVLSVTGYVANPANGTVAIGSTPYRLAIAFGSAPSPVVTNVTITESGLPSGGLWSAIFGGQTESGSGSLVFPVAPGTYAYQILSVSGYNVSPASGTAYVGTAPYQITATFTEIPVPVLTTVSVTESGLASGTSWTALVGGTPMTGTDPTLHFDVTPGTYAFQVPSVSGYTVAPANGTILVGTTPYTLAITFTAVPVPVETTVTVTQSGLPVGASWTGILGGVVKQSTSSTISFTVAPGTYAYQVLPVAGYSAAPGSGTVTVGASPYALGVTFSPVLYVVTVSESGLPSGTSWSASVDGAVQSTTGSSLAWNLANGTYSVSVTAVSGYTLSGVPTTIPVAGNAAGAAVVFTSTAPAPAPATTTSPAFSSLEIALLIVVIALAILVLVLVLRRRGSPPPSNGADPSSSGSEGTVEASTTPPDETRGVFEGELATAGTASVDPSSSGSAGAAATLSQVVVALEEALRGAEDRAPPAVVPVAEPAYVIREVPVEPGTFAIAAPEGFWGSGAEDRPRTAEPSVRASDATPTA